MQSNQLENSYLQNADREDSISYANYNPNFPSFFYTKAKSLKKLFNIRNEEVEIIKPPVYYAQNIRCMRGRILDFPIERSKSKQEVINKILTKRQNSQFNYIRQNRRDSNPENTSQITPRINITIGRESSRVVEKMKYQSRVNTPKIYKNISQRPIRPHKVHVFPHVNVLQLRDSEPLTGWVA